MSYFSQQLRYAPVAAISILLFYTSCILATNLDHPSSPQLVHQYPPGTWVENLAIRPNGDILPIELNSGTLNTLNIAIGDISQLYQFPSPSNQSTTLSIVAVLPDLFVVNVLPCRVATPSCTGNMTETYTIDFRHNVSTATKSHTPVIIQLNTNWTNAGLLNGGVALTPNIILFADSFRGGIWSLDIRTSSTTFLFTDPLMTGILPTKPTGINGIRLQDNKLYFTNSAQGTLGHMIVDSATGLKRVNITATVVASGLLKPDDFDVLSEYAYVADGGANKVVRVRLGTGEKNDVVTLPGPTSVRLLGEHGDGVDGQARGRKLAISTMGGYEQFMPGHNLTLGGAIYLVDL